MGCTKSKAKTPTREEQKEIEEKEKAEKEQAEKEQAEKEKAEKEKAEKEKAEKEEADKAAEEARRREQEEEERLAVEEAERRKAEEAARLAAEQERESAQLHVPGDKDQLSEVGSLSGRSHDLHSANDFDVTSEETLSTLETAAPRGPPATKVAATKHRGPHDFTGEAVTPCDMTAIDQFAAYTSSSCGCFLGIPHNENACTYCKEMDLSDAPLLN